MNPWAALLAGLLALAGIEALASQSLAQPASVRRQSVAQAPAVTDPRCQTHVDAVPRERQPFCTLFHCY